MIIDTSGIVLIESESGTLGVLDASLACCALESRAVLLSGKPWTGEELAGLVLLISGTISQKLAQEVQNLVGTFQELRPELTHYLVAVGACATSGGPYWDSSAVVPGLDKLKLNCDLYIPGCPPRPTEIRSGVVKLLERRTG